MRMHVLQHVPFEGPAAIAPWAQAHGFEMTSTALFENAPLPQVADFDWLVIMGGPMNIYEHGAYPWLEPEKRFIRAAIDAGKTVFGACLGGQLIADALGGKVTQNPHKEIGWWPVNLTQAGKRHAVFGRLPETFTPMHWHGDTFETPPGADAVAASEACQNQAFIYDNRVIGLQFHLEYTEESIEQMLLHCGDELAEGPFVQSAEAIRDGYGFVEPALGHMRQLLDGLLGQA